VQPTFKISGATHVRAPAANPGLATGMDLSDGFFASSSSSAPIAVTLPRMPLSSPFCIPEAPAVLAVESKLPDMAVGRSLKEVSDLLVKPLVVPFGPEAGLGSDVLVSDVKGDSSPFPFALLSSV
jgi:hypothetical protein